MQQWEYLTGFWVADVDKVPSDVFSSYWDRYGQGKPNKYAPQSLMPQFDQLGAAGWELIHIDPVVPGSNSDIQVPGSQFTYKGTGGGGGWTRTYFCVFKRPKGT